MWFGVGNFGKSYSGVGVGNFGKSKAGLGVGNFGKVRVEVGHFTSDSATLLLTTNRFNLRSDCSARCVTKCFYFCSMHAQQLSHRRSYAVGGPWTLCCSLTGPHA